MTCLPLILLGMGILWFGLRLQEEVLLIAAALTGGACLVWGFAMTPSSLQLLAEVAVAIIMFPVCTRCLDASRSPHKD